MLFFKGVIVRRERSFRTQELLLQSPFVLFFNVMGSQESFSAAFCASSN